MPANNSKSSHSAAQNIERARALFNFKNWAAEYFDVDDNGELVCLPKGRAGPAILFSKLVRQAAEDDLQAPLLIRFPDILSDRVQTVCAAFDRARRAAVYEGPHTIAYPVKVNQQKYVVEHIAKTNAERVGLEVGSKPELMAVLAQSLGTNQDERSGTVICNGYKDCEYIRLALIGSLFLKRIYIVIEQPDELDLVLGQAADLNVVPRLGVRVRLTSIAKGRWQNSGGEKSKFGLSASQLVNLVSRLQQSNNLNLLNLLHIHIGSQVADIKDIRAAAQEAGRYFQELSELGAGIKVLDVGGGLGIDYEGSHSSGLFSINYSVDEYALNIVSSIADCCQQSRLEQPEIITECGRALTAHHAVLVTNVIDVECQDQAIATGDISHPLAAELREILQKLKETKSISAVNKAILECDSLTQKIHKLFLEQEITLTQRALLDSLLMKIQISAKQVANSSENQEQINSDFSESVTDKYFCNFSLFQSVPDAWGIQQVFPIVPLSRLNEPLTRKAVVHDLTCDSDGQISVYPIDGRLMPTLPVHEIKRDEKYYLGLFLVGAYQEVLGDMHNLFGDTHSVNVTLTENGDYQMQDIEPGDRIDQLLEYVHYDCRHLLNQYKGKLDQAKLSAQEKEKYYQELVDGLAGYTYLED